MSSETVLMGKRKKIALVAHDNKKGDLLEWVKFNRYLLSLHELYATGTTGKLIEKEAGLEIIKLKSGPLGGDMQVGAKIANGEIDFLIFFWDPLESLPHDPDVKALLRMAVVWNIPVACNRSTADFMVSSTIMDKEYLRIIPDYENYRQRRIVGSGD
jgi:methylglyoxal synthase